MKHKCAAHSTRVSLFESPFKKRTCGAWQGHVNPALPLVPSVRREMKPGNPSLSLVLMVSLYLCPHAPFWDAGSVSCRTLHLFICVPVTSCAMLFPARTLATGILSAEGGVSEWVGEEKRVTFSVRSQGRYNVDGFHISV